MTFRTKLRFALAQKLIEPILGRVMWDEAEEVYRDIWPKHPGFDADNKKLIAFALLKAYTAGVADATRKG